MMPEPDSAPPVAGWISRQTAMRVFVSALVGALLLQVVSGWITLSDPDIRNGYGDARGWFFALGWNMGELTSWSLLALAVIPMVTPGVLSEGFARCLRWWGIPTALYAAVLSAASAYYRIVGRILADVPRRTTVSVAMGRDVPPALVALAAALVWIGEGRVRFPSRRRPKTEASVEPRQGEAAVIVELEVAPQPTI